MLPNASVSGDKVLIITIQPRIKPTKDQTRVSHSQRRGCSKQTREKHQGTSMNRDIIDPEVQTRSGIQLLSPQYLSYYPTKHYYVGTKFEYPQQRGLDSLCKRNYNYMYLIVLNKLWQTEILLIKSDFSSCQTVFKSHLLHKTLI